MKHWVKENGRLFRTSAEVLLICSVAVPEPVGAGTFWSQPEPV